MGSGASCLVLQFCSEVFVNFGRYVHVPPRLLIFLISVFLIAWIKLATIHPPLLRFASVEGAYLFLVFVPPLPIADYFPPSLPRSRQEIRFLRLPSPAPSRTVESSLVPCVSAIPSHPGFASGTQNFLLSD